ncbi:MAG: hypothetical protein HS111_34790 [Kofleriaceae bacterium]|nr:hypothetical protein [Kofleriaceae bacterium]
MTEHDPDLDGDDDAIARMAHGELVALLNRLYGRLGEKRISTSTALASGDDELRQTIRVVRRRLAAKLGVPAEPLPPKARRRAARELAAELTASEIPRPPDRVFVVLFASDSNLVSAARVACRARGVTLVAVASSDMMTALVANVTPTHVVVVGDGFDRGHALDLEHRGARLRICQGPEHAMQALAEIGA